jgi:demethylmenaquinone methyltransferase/2-methoxy-6-polyprenyl-1,4-benzoquinol methylase
MQTIVKSSGIDLSKDMLRIADDKKKKAQVPNIKLHCMDATNMKFKDKCFDKVLISLVLHEINVDLAEQILMEAKRVLKDDGEIIVTEWEKSNAHFRKILFIPIKLLEPKPFKEFIKKDLYSYFEQYGMKVVAEEHCDYSRVLKLKKAEC